MDISVDIFADLYVCVRVCVCLQKQNPVLPVPLIGFREPHSANEVPYLFVC